MSLEMAHKVILPPKKNYIPQFLKQRDINSYFVHDDSAASDLPRITGKIYPHHWYRSGGSSLIVPTAVTVLHIHVHVFRIRIHWVRNRIQHFWLNTGSGSRKLEKKLKKVWYFFDQKIAIYLSLDLLKWRPSYRRSLQPSKKHPSLQNMKFLNFFYFFFCTPDSGSGFRIHRLDWIRIQSGSVSGTEALIVSTHEGQHVFWPVVPAWP